MRKEKKNKTKGHTHHLNMKGMSRRISHCSKNTVLAIKQHGTHRPNPTDIVHVLLASSFSYLQNYNIAFNNYQITNAKYKRTPKSKAKLFKI